MSQCTTMYYVTKKKPSLYPEERKEEHEIGN